MKLFWLFERVETDLTAPDLVSSTTSYRLSVWLLAVVLVGFGVWSYWAEVDQLTRAPGTVIASSKTKMVQSSEPGIVQSILAREGSSVVEGQPVIILEPSRTQSAVDEIEAELASLLAAKARLLAEIDETTLVFPSLLEKFPEFVENQRTLRERRETALEDELESIQVSLSLVEDELALLRPLVSRGDVSESEVIRLERQRSELGGAYANVKNKFYRDAASELERTSSVIASLEQQLNQRRDRLERTTIIAPVNGIVKNLTINSPGAVVGAGDVLMEILPIDDRLIVEAQISPAEIAFVRTGMEAIVKVDAYDYSIYGDLRGTLTYLSADTLVESTKNGSTPYYRAQVTTTSARFSKQSDRDFEILPGMTAVVEIKTGKSTVFNYLAKPLTKTVSESFSDR